MSHRAPDGARCLFGAVGYKHLDPPEPYARNIWLLRSLTLETSGSYGASLVPERLERIHFRCAARGDVASEQRHEQQQQRDDYEREWILLTNTK